MKTPKAPKAPDPVATAAAQTQTNVATATANAYLGNVNQVTPDGSLTYTEGPRKFIEDSTSGQLYYRDSQGNISGTKPTIAGSLGGKLPPGYTTVKGFYSPTFTATTKLSDTQQAIKDEEDAASLNLGKIANQQSQRIGDLLSTTLDTSKLPAAGDVNSITAPTYTRFGGGPQLRTNIGDAGQIADTFGDAGAITRTYGGDYEQGRQRVEDAMYSRLNPQIERDRAALETSLANKGISVGSAAYQGAMDNFSRGVSDQRTAITLAGGQEQSRLAGLDQARAGFENAAQAQDYLQKQGRATFGNAAQAQRFGQMATAAGFENDARQTMFGNEQARIEANNGLQDRDFANQTTRFGLQNQSRQNALTEATALRQMPINEISALLSNAQITPPNFVATNMPTVPTTDYAGLVSDNYKNRLAAWQQKVQSQNATLGALAGVAGAGLGGWLGRG